MSVQYRVLPPEEWERLRSLPFGQNGLPGPATIVMVAEDGPDIVGVWAAGTAIVMEGLWVHDAFQKTTTAFNLFMNMQDLLKQCQVPQVLTIVETEYVKQLALRLGFVEAPGDLLLLNLQDK